MTRLFGTALILLAGAGAAHAALRRRRDELRTLQELLYALHRMESAVRCERRPLYPLFSALAEELTGEGGDFFRALLAERGETRSLTADWERGAASLTLPPEGLRLWRELGRRLGGDGESVARALALTEGELTSLRQSVEQALPRERRVWTALSLSAAAFLIVLLL